jgi:hypothetical protein
MSMLDIYERTNSFKDAGEIFTPEVFEADRFVRSELEKPINLKRDHLLERLATQLQTRPIVEIAALIRNLTYGDMIDLAEGIWNAQPTGSAITKENLPNLLYQWSTTSASRRAPVLSREWGNPGESEHQRAW